MRSQRFESCRTLPTAQYRLRGEMFEAAFAPDPATEAESESETSWFDIWWPLVLVAVFCGCVLAAVFTDSWERLLPFPRGRVCA